MATTDAVRFTQWFKSGEIEILIEYTGVNEKARRPELSRNRHYAGQARLAGGPILYDTRGHVPKAYGEDQERVELIEMFERLQPTEPRAIPARQVQSAQRDN